MKADRSKFGANFEKNIYMIIPDVNHVSFCLTNALYLVSCTKIQETVELITKTYNLQFRYFSCMPTHNCIAV